MNTVTELSTLPTIGASKGQSKKTSKKKTSALKVTPVGAKKEKPMAKNKRKSPSMNQAAIAVRQAGGKVYSKHKGPMMVAGSKVSSVGDLANAKKFSKATIQKALDETHTMTAVGAAAVVGYLKGSGSMPPQLEGIGGLSSEAVLGIGAWLGAQYTKSQMLKHGATGLLSAAAFSMAQAAAVEGVDDDEY